MYSVWVLLQARKAGGDLATVSVLTTCRVADGKIAKPTAASPGDVVRGCSVVPVLRTAGGVWISVNAKKKTIDYGIILEATDLLVFEEPAASSAFNFGGVEVADEVTEEFGSVAAFNNSFV